MGLIVHELGQVPDLEQFPIVLAELVDLISQIVVRIDVLIVTHLYLVELRLATFTVDFELPDHIEPMLRVFLQSTHKDSGTAIANVEIVLIVSDTPSFLDFLR